MADPKERLFRDDAGAAIERIHRLEEENRALRAEIARIKRPGLGKAGQAVVVVIVAAGALALGVMQGYGAGEVNGRYDERHRLCDPPTWTDGQGAEHLKPNCGTR